jgi:alpha-glucosidase
MVLQTMPNKNPERLREPIHVGRATLLRWPRRAGLIASLGLAAALGQGNAADGVTEIPLLPGEHWWGGRVVDASLMPYVATTKLQQSLHGFVGGNQACPLLVSSAGRYVWSDAPFDFSFDGGRLKVAHPRATVRLEQPGRTLAEAFRAAARAHFPADGRMPDPLLFSVPQYNTWIELTYNQNQEDVLKYARTLIAQGYPPGVLMIDDTWQEAYGAWDFSPRRFADPKAMMRELHALGFKVMLWVCPFISADSPEFRQVAREGGLLRDPALVNAPGRPHEQAALVRWWNGASGLLDLSSAAGRAWFEGRLDWLVRTYSVDGFKLDAGDPEFYLAQGPCGSGATPATGAPRALVSAQPRDAQEHCADFAAIGLKYPLNEYRACWKMAGRPLVQRLRDKNHEWEDLRALVPGLIAQGLMGYAFVCPDMIGGGDFESFLNRAKFDEELVVRSAQVHALAPMMQFSVAPWRVLSPENAALCLAAAQLHARYGARIVALAREAARTGEPILRPLAWQWPHQGYEPITDQFLLGADLLVAPVVEKGARKRSITFPPGRWRGDDGSLVAGPTTKEVDAPLARLPHYERQR